MFTQLPIRIDKDSADRLRRWARQKAVDLGGFSLNKWIVNLVKEGMTKEGI
jgi:hypothetical protein